MHIGNKELLEAITKSVPQKFFADIITDLNNAHKDACAHLESNFSQPVARDALPIYRRAIVEDKVKVTARKHNFIANSVYNRIKSASHVEIEIEIDSKKIVLTTLAVPTCYDMTKLRTARFRKTLAEESQFYLFKELIEAGDGYYGLLLYGAKPQSKEIEFAYIGFPTANCKEWFGHYNAHKLALKVNDIENIKDKSDPKLRTNIIRKENE